MAVIKMTDLNLQGKRVLIRADLNVPVSNGKVTSDARISASMATINFALEAGAKVMVTSHLGRPEEGVYSEENSLQPVVDVISAKLNRPVRLIKNWLDGEVCCGGGGRHLIGQRIGSFRQSLAQTRTAHGGHRWRQQGLNQANGIGKLV
jgi:hypothetical protein